jgi:WD40 repeat protein
MQSRKSTGRHPVSVVMESGLLVVLLAKESTRFTWDRAGHLVKILEGPKEALIDLAWHPVRPIVVSVSLCGIVYIWAKEYIENWSAFAPDFKEIEENEEYVEREDEFDLNPDTDNVCERYMVIGLIILFFSILWS